MSRLRLVLAAALAVSALAVLAVPASASVPAANAKFCKAASKIGNNASNASGFTKAQAKKLTKQFKAAAKHAPAKVKKATNEITKVLGLIAGATDPTDLPRVYSSDSFKKYPNAVTTFFTYQASQCIGT
jgi:hypothetical protein